MNVIYCTRWSTLKCEMLSMWIFLSAAFDVHVGVKIVNCGWISYYSNSRKNAFNSYWFKRVSKLLVSAFSALLENESNVFWVFARA